jgi:hypothetical protein
MLAIRALIGLSLIHAASAQTLACAVPDLSALNFEGAPVELAGSTIAGCVPGTSLSTSLTTGPSCAVKCSASAVLSCIESAPSESARFFSDTRPP